MRSIVSNRHYFEKYRPLFIGTVYSVGRNPTNNYRKAKLSERGTKCREGKNDKGSNIEPRDSSDVNRSTLVAEVTFSQKTLAVRMPTTINPFKWLPVMCMTPYMTYLRHQYVAVHIPRKANFSTRNERL